MREEEQARLARRQRITEISQRIEQLSIELNDLLLEEQDTETSASNDDLADQEGTAANRPSETTSNRSTGNVDYQRQRSTSRAASTSNNSESDQQQEQQYTIGQRVVILNHYKNLRGKIGLITKVTKKQVTLSVPGQASPVVRSKTNVRVIP